MPQALHTCMTKAVIADVLSMRTAANTYHFGLYPGRYWKCDLPFPATRTKSKGWKNLTSPTVFSMRVAR
jgi:hypothetical protein